LVGIKNSSVAIKNSGAIMNHKMRFLFTALFLFFFQSVNAKNGWVSSGGELLKDRNNPWFLKNVSKVSVCMSHDSEGFSLSPQRAQELIELALHYWKQEFLPLDPSLGIVSQTFEWQNESCKGHEDLAFRLGYGSLNSEEHEWFVSFDQRPQAYAGLAIRKEYLVDSMKGRGVVLIASDTGAERFQNGRGVPNRFWQNEGLFLRVMVHELGHVFGLPHEVSGIMGEKYPDEIIRRFREGRQNLRLIDNLPPFFRFPKKAKLHTVSYKGTDLGSGPILGPIQFLFPIFATIDDVNVLFEQSHSDGLNHRLLAPIHKGSLHSKLEFPLQVYLPEGQRVFTTALPGTYLMGPARIQQSLTAKYKDEAIEERGSGDSTKGTVDFSMHLSVRPNGMLITTFSDSGSPQVIELSVGE